MDDRPPLVRLRAFTREYPVREAVSDAWEEHGPYVGFATVLFALGLVIGASLAAAGYDLLELMAELVGEDPFPEFENEEFDLTARFFIVHNTPPYLMAIVGALTVGLLTTWIIVFNGIVVGNVAAVIGSDVGYDFVFVGVAPHGIFELPALFIAAGVGYRLLHRFAQRVRGTRKASLSKPYLYRTGIFVVVGWLLLVLAAFVEAYVTPFLLEALFAERLEGVGEVAAEVATNGSYGLL